MCYFEGNWATLLAMSRLHLAHAEEGEHSRRWHCTGKLY